MNGINAFQPDIHTGKWDTNAQRKRVVPVSETKSSTESNKRNVFKALDIDRYNDYESKQQAANKSEVILANKRFYRSDLLSAFYQKMSGLESETAPGNFVEYYA